MFLWAVEWPGTPPARSLPHHYGLRLYGGCPHLGPLSGARFSSLTDPQTPVFETWASPLLFSPGKFAIRPDKKSDPVIKTVKSVGMIAGGTGTWTRSPSRSPPRADVTGGGRGVGRGAGVSACELPEVRDPGPDVPAPSPGHLPVSMQQALTQRVGLAILQASPQCCR